MSKQKCVKCGLRKAIAHSDKCFRCANWQWNKPAREKAEARREKEAATEREAQICVGCGYLRDDPRFVEPGYLGIQHHVCPQNGCAMIALSGDDKGAG